MHTAVVSNKYAVENTNRNVRTSYDSVTGESVIVHESTHDWKRMEETESAIDCVMTMTNESGRRCRHERCPLDELHYKLPLKSQNTITYGVR
jgi:hypothetical protein